MSYTQFLMFKSPSHKQFDKYFKYSILNSKQTCYKHSINVLFSPGLQPPEVLPAANRNEHF